MAAQVEFVPPPDVEPERQKEAILSFSERSILVPGAGLGTSDGAAANNSGRPVMTLEQLRVFVEVAERLHVTQAAAALNMTQPAASAAIHALETRLGTALFNRVGRRLELTEVGTVLLPEAKVVLAKVAQAEQSLTELEGLLRGRLRLWASQTIAGYWLPPFLYRFHVAWAATGSMSQRRLQAIDTVRRLEIELRAPEAHDPRQMQVRMDCRRGSFSIWPSGGQCKRPLLARSRVLPAS